jgi:hypothetical protein
MPPLGRGVAELAPLTESGGSDHTAPNLNPTVAQVQRTDCKIHLITCGDEGIGHTMPTTPGAAVHLGATD